MLQGVGAMAASIGAVTMPCTALRTGAEVRVEAEERQTMHEAQMPTSWGIRSSGACELQGLCKVIWGCCSVERASDPSCSDLLSTKGLPSA